MDNVLKCYLVESENFFMYLSLLWLRMVSAFVILIFTLSLKILSLLSSEKKLFFDVNFLTFLNTSKYARLNENPYIFFLFFSFAPKLCKIFGKWLDNSNTKAWKVIFFWIPMIKNSVLGRFFGPPSMTKLITHHFYQKLELLQYSACLAMTGAIRGTSREKLYEELGLESLQLRR